VKNCTYVTLLVCMEEMIYRYLEYRQRSLGEILFFFYKTLYLWMTVYVPLLLISYSDFFVRFTFAS
jgi:hypothetical protein